MQAGNTMTKPDPTAAARNARKRQRKAQAGLQRVEEWVPPSGVPAIRELAEKLRAEKEAEE